MNRISPCSDRQKSKFKAVFVICMETQYRKPTRGRQLGTLAQCTELWYPWVET